MQALRGAGTVLLTYSIYRLYSGVTPVDYIYLILENTTMAKPTPLYLYGPSECTIYSETWELGTPKGLRKTVLNSEVVLFLRSISTYCIRLGTEVHVAVLNSQGVPISQVVLKTGFTVYTSTPLAQNSAK